MTPSVCQFNAQKDGRPVAARNFQPVVLWPIFRGVSGGTFYACSSTESCTRDSGAAPPANEATSDARSGCRSARSLDGARPLDASLVHGGNHAGRASVAAHPVGALDGSIGAPDRTLGSGGGHFFYCGGDLFHFLFLSRGCPSFFYLGANIYPYLYNGKRKRAEKVRFFNGRNRRYLRRAVARTQNPKVLPLAGLGASREQPVVGPLN